MFSILGYALAATSASTTALGAYNLFRYFGRRAAEKIRDRARANKIAAQQSTIVEYVAKVYEEVTPVLPALKEARDAWKGGDKKAAAKKVIADLTKLLGDEDAAAKV
jgi:hypothetical protein